MCSHKHPACRCRPLAASAALNPSAALICAYQQFPRPDHGAGVEQVNEANVDDDGSWWTPAMDPVDCGPVRLTEVS